jgi:hypothetical protein
MTLVGPFAPVTNEALRMPCHANATTLLIALGHELTGPRPDDRQISCVMAMPIRS